MGTSTGLPFTMSMKRFAEPDSVPSVETYFAIDQQTVVFNQDLVEAASLKTMTPQLASVCLHLKDGTTVEKQFDMTGAVVAEKKIRKRPQMRQ